MSMQRVDRPAFTRGTNLLLVPTCAVILIAGLQAGASLIVPVVVAGFLTLLCLPGLQRLQRLGLSASLAIPIVITIGLLGVLAVGGLVYASVDQFAERIPEYDRALKEQRWYQFAIGHLERFGVIQGPEVADEKLRELLDPGQVFVYLATLLGSILGELSNLFVIGLLLVFMLAEASCLGAKIQQAFGQPSSVLGEIELVKNRVVSYVSIKAGVSLLTGVLVAGLIAALGVDFPVLWGFVAFLFNFIPNIGSILAAVPPVLIAMIQPGPGTAALVAAGYLLINLVVGNFIEPRLMGKRLGLSTLVVFLSLVFWAWVWGPIGMLLSVPLTVIVKIVLEHVDEFRPLAVLLGPGEPPSR